MKDNLLEMPQDNPFQNDLFDRKTIAENFMKIFKTDEEGIILSIDSAWGTGKTTFIKMWEMMINNSNEYKDKYETFYFNAWENDYIQDPLLAILTEIEVNDDKKKQVFEKIKNKNLFSKLNEEVLSKFLKAFKSIEDYNIDLESEEFIISLNDKWEALNMEYLFSNKQCSLIKNLEFVESISMGE